MLSIVHLEEIEGLLLQLPGLVRQQEEHAVDYVKQAGLWLAALEQSFTANRLYQAGNIAVLRSGLVAVEQGQVPAGLEFRSPPTRGKLLSAAAAQALQRAAEVATQLLAENRPRITEAERVAQQIIAAALARGLIPARDAQISHTQYLRLIRRSFPAGSDLENAAVHLEGLVGAQDCLICLDRALARFLSV